MQPALLVLIDKRRECQHCVHRFVVGGFGKFLEHAERLGLCTCPLRLLVAPKVETCDPRI